MIVNADGSISPGNTLERRPNDRKSAIISSSLSTSSSQGIVACSSLSVGINNGNNTLERRGSGKKTVDSSDGILISPANTLERRGSRKKTVGNDGDGGAGIITISPGNTLERRDSGKSKYSIVDSDGGSISPGNTLERRSGGKKTETVQQEGIFISPGNTLERKSSFRKSAHSDGRSGSVSPGDTLERRGSGKNNFSQNLVDAVSSKLETELISSKGGNAVIVSATGSLEKKKKPTAGARVNLMHMSNGHGGNGGDVVNANASIANNKTGDDSSFPTSSAVEPHYQTLLAASVTNVENIPPMVKNAVILPRNRRFEGEGSPEPTALERLSTSRHDKTEVQDGYPPLDSLSSQLKDIKFVEEDDEENLEASKPSSEVMVASAQLMSSEGVGEAAVTVNPTASSSKGFSDDFPSVIVAASPPSAVATMEPVVVQRVVMPDVVPLQEQQIQQHQQQHHLRNQQHLQQRDLQQLQQRDLQQLQNQPPTSSRMIAKEKEPTFEVTSTLAQRRDLDAAESPEPNGDKTPPMPQPMDEIDVSCYQGGSPLSPKLDLRIQQKFDELLEKQIQQQLEQQKFDELLELQIQHQMAKKQQLQQQQQRQQQQQDFQPHQQQNHYAAPKPNPTPVVQLRSQQWSTQTNQQAGTSLQQQQNQPHVVKQQQQQQQQYQQIISKPPSKPPRKFNLDTLSRVIEEDEEELQALIREEIARKNGKGGFP